MRNLTKSLLLSVALATCAGVANAACDTTTWAGCTAGDVYNAEFEALARNVADSGDKVRDAPAATTAPSSFAGRIHSSYEDFLKPLAFAINSVDESEDGKALVVRFNPLRSGRHRLGLSLTVVEPEVGEEVSEGISDSGREDTIALLAKKLGDFDDLTIAASYTLQSKRCSLSSETQERCYGRDPSLYSSLLAGLIPSPDADSDDAIDIAKQVALAVPDPRGDTGVFERPLSSDPTERAKQVALLLSLARADRSATRGEVQALAAAGTDLFWPLIDNQPQLAATWSRREADPLVGQSYDSLSLELQFGRVNVNSLFRACEAGDFGCVRSRLVALAQEKTERGAKLTDDKFVLTASYLKRRSYSVEELPLVDAPGEFTPIELAESSEFKAKLQWGALVATKVGGWTPRVDFSAESLETRDDGVRTKSRWVATATVTLPIAEGVAIPISLNYANKPEFLSESQETFGAHVGFSYRLPFGDAASAGSD